MCSRLNDSTAFTDIGVHFSLRLKNAEHLQYIETAHGMTVVGACDKSLGCTNAGVRQGLTSIQTNYGVGVKCCVYAHMVIQVLSRLILPVQSELPSCVLDVRCIGEYLAVLVSYCRRNFY